MIRRKLFVLFRFGGVGKHSKPTTPKYSFWSKKHQSTCDDALSAFVNKIPNGNALWELTNDSNLCVDRFMEDTVVKKHMTSQTPQQQKVSRQYIYMFAVNNIPRCNIQLVCYEGTQLNPHPTQLYTLLSNLHSNLTYYLPKWSSFTIDTLSHHRQTFSPSTNFLTIDTLSHHRHAFSPSIKSHHRHTFSPSSHCHHRHTFTIDTLSPSTRFLAMDTLSPSTHFHLRHAFSIDTLSPLTRFLHRHAFAIDTRLPSTHFYHRHRHAFSIDTLSPSTRFHHRHTFTIDTLSTST
jgi:hypothetical protein